MADLIKTLRVGVDELLYAAITTTGVQQYFALPPQTMNFRGSVVFAFAPTPSNGTITGAITFSVLAQLQPQGILGAPSIVSPQGILARQVLVSAAANTQSAYSGLSLGTTTLPTPVVVDLSGFGGSGLLALNITAVTLGTATSFAVYARIG